MRIDLFEATNGFNWGKFALGRWTPEEWNTPTRISDVGAPSLLVQSGWNPNSFWVMDLQTGEAARFTQGGVARRDLEKHRIWVCPLFEPFLDWLYRQDLDDPQLPKLVHLDGAERAVYGYRRTGESESELPEGEPCG